MDLLKEIRGRKSVRTFLDKDVEREKIDLLIEAARWAPSCFNNQPWKYVFFRKGGKNRKAAEGALKPGNNWAKKAPYLVVVGANPEDDCKTNGVPYYAYDSGLSTMNFTIEAEHLGLRAHHMAGFDGEAMKKAAGFPDNFEVVVVIALGYEAESKKLLSKLSEGIKDKVLASRDRKNSSESFFFGSYAGR
jgi:nitroreductase